MARETDFFFLNQAMTLQKEGRRNKGVRPKKKIPSVVDKLGQEWPVFLHAEVYTVELNQSRFVGRSAGVEFTMGLAKLASPSRTLRSEGGALQKECHATYNLKLNPMRVKLPTPFEGALSGEGACVRLSQIIDDLCSYTRPAKGALPLPIVRP